MYSRHPSFVLLRLVCFWLWFNYFYCIRWLNIIFSCEIENWFLRFDFFYYGVGKDHFSFYPLSFIWKLFLIRILIDCTKLILYFWQFFPSERWFFLGIWVRWQIRHYFQFSPIFCCRLQNRWSKFPRNFIYLAKLVLKLRKILWQSRINLQLRRMIKFNSIRWWKRISRINSFKKYIWRAHFAISFKFLIWVFGTLLKYSHKARLGYFLKWLLISVQLLLVKFQFTFFINPLKRIQRLMIFQRYISRAVCFWWFFWHKTTSIVKINLFLLCRIPWCVHILFYRKFINL